MRLDAFRFRHLGPFGASGVSVDGLRDGLNVVAERNERGKSSLLAGLTLLLFKPHVSSDASVRALTHGDGSPEGEIDFRHDGRDYRLVKRFRTGRTAELLDRATGETLARRGEAEERLKAMLGADGKGHGPSGLLWVRQGNSMEAAADDGHVAARLETELTTLVGGDRARDYLLQTNAQLGELLTRTGKPKKGGPLQLAQDALATGEAELEAARAAARDVRETGRQLAEVNDRLARLAPEDGEAMQAQIAEARAQLAAARTARSALDAAEASARSAAMDAEHAGARLESFLASCAERDRLGEDAERLRERIEADERERTAAQAALADANERRAGLQDIQMKAAAHERAERLRERIADRNAALQALLGTLEAAEGAQREVDGLVAQWEALPPVDAAAVDRLAGLERERDAARAALERLEIVLDLTLEPNATATLDGAPVRSGPVRLGAAGELVLPGAGRLRLAMPEAESLQRELDQAEASLADALERLGVESFEDAARRATARADVAAELALAKKQRSLLAPDGLDALHDARASLEADVETLAASLEPLVPEPHQSDDDPRALAERLAEADGARDAAQARLNELERERATLTERLAARRRELSALPEETRKEARDAHAAALTATSATAAKRAEDAQAELERRRAHDPEDPSFIEARIEKLEAIARNRAGERAALLTEKTKLETMRREAFERRDPDMEAKRLEGRVERLGEDVARHQRRADALTLLRDTLQSSQSRLRDAYTAPVRSELLPLLRRVIDGADLELSEDLGATALLRDGAPDALERLSGGTREQIAVLTRLAFARLLARGGQPTPVILDDALVYADDARRARMFDVLNYVARGEDGLQLLYLSCHADATEQLGGHRLTLADWPAQG